MREREWLTKEMQRSLHWRLAAWSDGAGYRQACELAESYRHLLPRPVTSAQLHGLRNVVAAAPDYETIRKFTDRQGEKAERRGDLELRDYWRAVGKVMDRLRGDVEALLTAIGGDDLHLAKKPLKAARGEIHKQLIGAFVQHLVAHSAYLSGK